MSSLVSRGVQVGQLLPRLLRCSVTRCVRGARPAVVTGHFRSLEQRRWLSAAVSEEEEVTEGTVAASRDLQKKPKSGAWQELMDRKLYKVDMDVRRNGRVGLLDLENVVKTVVKSGQCTANQALLILRCCGSIAVDLGPEARTALLAKYLTILKEVPGLTFDVSHYNAILKVHLENGNNLAASDYLGEMEEAGVSPNRVTFQHLVGLYCLGGNITGATTVLEHMKDQGMAINEAVFLSLLSGHCLNLDHSSVTSTLAVMANSGLLLGAESYAVVAASYGRAGDWDKVLEMLARAEVDQVKMGDGDLLAVMVGCCRGGLELQARKNLVQKLPKKTGYFQEMRNYVPQLLQAGGASLAIEIFLDDRFGRHDDRADKGKFVLESVVRSGLSGAASLEVVDKMEPEGYERAMEFLVEASMKYGTLEYNKELKTVLKEAGKHPVDTKSIKDFVQFLRRAVTWDGDAVLERVNNLRGLGFTMPSGVFSNDLLFSQLDLAGGVTPRDTVNRLLKELPNMSLSFLMNSMLQCLLNKEDKEHLTAATNYLLNGTVSRFINPTAWSQSLVRAFLATGDTEQLVTFLWYCSRPSVITSERAGVTDVFGGLTCVPAVLHRFEDTEQSVEVQLRTVVEALIKERVGVPGEVAAKLQEQEAVLAELLQEAVTVWEAGEEYWTEERIADYLNARKTQHLPPRDGSGTRPGFVGEYSGVPESLAAMEAAQEKLEAQGKCNKALVSQLIDARCAAGQVDKALALVNYAVEKHEFGMGPINTNNLLSALVAAGRLGEALDFLQGNLGSGGDRKVFGSNFVDVLVLLAEQEKHEQVLELVQSYSPYQFINGFNANAHAVCNVYSKEGQEEKMETVRQTLISQGWIKKNDLRTHFNKLKTLMEAKDMNVVLDEVEKIVKDTGKFPLKQDVSKQLIQMEDLDLLQRMLDISIESQGEERALMDLAMSFLDLGKKAQAKKLLETPGLRYHQAQMAFMAAHFRSSGNLEALESLVSLSRNVFGCDRDFLFSQLVEAFQGSPDRVEEVWMEIQEEGHAPSDSLKIAIARALEAGGRKVPFEVPEEYVRQVEEQQTATAKMVKARSPQPKSSQPRSSQPRSSQPKAMKVRRPDDLKADHAVASPILAAIDGKDLVLASQLIKEGIEGKTLKTSARIVLEKFCQADLAEGAKISAFAVNSLDDEGSVMSGGEIVKHTRAIISIFGQKNDLTGLAGFMDSLSEKRRQLNSHNSHNSEKIAAFLHSPADYLQLVTGDPSGATAQSWMLGHQVLKQAADSTLAQLEVLAKEGNIAAACLLCRAGLGREDRGLVERSWERLEDKKVWGPLIFTQPKKEDIQLLTRTVVSEDLKELLKHFLDKSNNITITSIVELTTVAMSETSLQLGDLQDHTLRSLAKAMDFQDRDKVKDILEARKLQPTTGSSSS